MSGLNVLIVGASVAGPTTAYWMAKAGAKVTIIERFPSLRTGGQAIDIRTCGVSVMRKMDDMETQVRSKYPPIEGMSFVNDDGQSYGVIRASGNPDQQTLLSEYEIFRGDLSKILFDMTKNNRNINYIFGEQISAMHQSETGDGPITVDFANGTKTSDYDLVVACDGGTSRTRALGLESEVRDHVVPVNMWAAYFSIKDGIVPKTNIGQAHTAIGGRFMAVGSDLSGGNRTTLMTILPGGQDDTLPFRQAMERGDVELRKYIAEVYRGAGWKIDDILDEMMDAPDFYASEIFQVKVPSLSKGRFVMVGDAGYAPGPTGGGTSLALTGGYLLAGEICKHHGDVAAGLRGYEEQMRPIIDKMQKIPPLLSFLAPQTSWGIELRNRIFGFVAWSGIADVAQRFFGGAFGSSDEFPLPNYEWVD